MDCCIQAIYEHGVLRPLEPLQLQESEIVSLLIQKPADQDHGAPSRDEEVGRQQREMLLAFIANMESMPEENPQDGLTNRDHDRLIYGS